MLKRIKNGGILALVFAAGMAVLQPASAQAADRHPRGGYQNQVRVDRNWDRARSGDRGRDYRAAPTYYYTPAPSYNYRYNSYPVRGYPRGYACPR